MRTRRGGDEHTAPPTTTIQAGAPPRRRTRTPPEHLEQRAAGLRQPVPLHQVRPESTSGIAADFTASAMRTQPCITSIPRISAPVARPALGRRPAEEQGDDRDDDHDPATTTRSSSTLRRSKRSMNTPMNGLMNV